MTSTESIDGPATAPAARDRFDLLAVAPLVGATFLAKLSLPPLGSRGLNLFYPILILTLLVGLATGRVTFVAIRLAWFAATAAAIAVIQLFGVEEFSPTSLALFVLVGLALAVQATSSSVARSRAWFGSAAAVIACAGVAQFALQFVLPIQLVFPLEHLVPDGWRTQMFNSVATVDWRLAVYRVNGVFMLEASEFSQLCAIALVNEVTADAPKNWRVTLFAVAIVLSYSGTGVMILAATLPLVVIRAGRWDLVGRGLLLLVLMAALAGPLHLDATLGRLNEFSGPGSSGYARFFGWTSLFTPAHWPNATTVLFGHGAGQSNGLGDTVYCKILYEYGAIAGTAYLAFAVMVLFSSPCPLPLRVAVFLCAFWMNGAYSAWAVANVLTLLAWPNDQTRPPAEALDPAVTAPLGMSPQVGLQP